VPTLLTRSFTDDEARSVTAWNYPPPFDLYNIDPGNTALFTDRDEAGHGYYPALDENGTVVAFCVVGPEARVRGQQPQDEVLDIGLGVHPDHTSRGLASELLEQVDALARDLFQPRQRRAGFTPARDFTGPGDRTFRELTRNLDLDLDLGPGPRLV